MTEQERQLIAGLAERIQNAPGPQIDRDADDLIRRTIATRPDALYILTQTVLLQEMALNQTKAQLEQLRGQPAQGQGGFLHSAPSDYQASGYQAAPPPPPPSYGSGGGLSGFLHNAATTAAGVLAGEVAFESLSSLFGHRGGGFFGGGGGGFFGSPSGLVPGSETIVNNYGDGTDGGDGGSRFGDAAAASGDQMSSDIQDERDNSGDAFADSSGDDSSSGDDGSSFDGGGDDGSSF